MASNLYSQGAQVEHQKFGLGTVLSSSEERIVIKFDDHGEKKFVTNMVMGSLKKSDRQPPRRKEGLPQEKNRENRTRHGVMPTSEDTFFERTPKTVI
ncbi:MAG TPA: hypothetical protein VHP11_16070 [Tepidisphaeraceae bacterium]|nr:hypothetical protein [Tepidisphaeraceae bacterium]